MKHLASLFLLSFLLCCSCSQQMDDEWKPNEQLPNVPETHPVGVSFSRASLETFAEHGITEVGVYVYLQDSMVYGKNLPLNNGDLKVDLPLGENLQTFIVANADHLVDTDSLSKVVVYQDAHIQKPVYISDVVGFTSDNSVSSLNVELKRLVGQAVFQPKETEEELSAITRFAVSRGESNFSRTGTVPIRSPNLRKSRRSVFRSSRSRHGRPGKRRRLRLGPRPFWRSCWPGRSAYPKPLSGSLRAWTVSERVAV